MVTWHVLTGYRVLMVVFTDLEVGWILILSCLFNLSQWNGLYRPLLVTAVHSYWEESHIYCFYFNFLNKTDNFQKCRYYNVPAQTHSQFTFSLWASRSRQKSSEVQTVIIIPNIPSTSGMPRNAARVRYKPNSLYFHIRNIDKHSGSLLTRLVL